MLRFGPQKTINGWLLLGHLRLSRVIWRSKVQFWFELADFVARIDFSIFTLENLFLINVSNDQCKGPILIIVNKMILDRVLLAVRVRQKRTLCEALCLVVFYANCFQPYEDNIRSQYQWNKIKFKTLHLRYLIIRISVPKPLNFAKRDAICFSHNTFNLVFYKEFLILIEFFHIFQLGPELDQFSLFWQFFPTSKTCLEKLQKFPLPVRVPENIWREIRQLLSKVFHYWCNTYV